MDSTLIDHEKRLTRLEDRFEYVMAGVLDRLKVAEDAAGKIDALNERFVNMARRIDALEAAQPTAVSAGSIGLAPSGS